MASLGTLRLGSRFRLWAIWALMLGWAFSAVVFAGAPEGVVRRKLRSVECSGSGGGEVLELWVASNGRLLLSKGAVVCALSSAEAMPFAAALARAKDWVESGPTNASAHEGRTAKFTTVEPAFGEVGLLAFGARAPAAAKVRLTLPAAGPAPGGAALELTAPEVAVLLGALAELDEELRLARAEAAETGADPIARTKAPPPSPDFAMPAETSARMAAGARWNVPDTWFTPKAAYPFAAHMRQITGQGAVLVSTDAFGRVVQAQMVRPIHPLLDAVVESHARAAWTGPARATKTVPVSYSLPK